MVKRNESLYYAKLLERVSISFDLNSVPLLECNILGKPNFNMMSKNKWFTSVIVFLS